MNNAISIRGLTKHYPGFELQPLDLDLPSGSILGLVGENGAGKSTTIRLIMELIRKDSGTVEIFGRSLDREMKEDIGVVLDSVGLPASLNAVQIGKIMADVYKRWDQAKYDELIRVFDIPVTEKFGKMSNGTKMKVGLAIAFSHHPKLLILDEATNGLDPLARDRVNEMLNEFTREEDHSVLVSSHIVSDLEKICDYIAFLHKGQLMLCEEKDVLAGEYGILKCSREEADRFSEDDLIYRKDGLYATELVVRRSALPADLRLAPIRIEDLFILMVKGGEEA